jgi:hypothetical protein
VRASCIEPAGIEARTDRDVAVLVVRASVGPPRGGGGSGCARPRGRSVGPGRNRGGANVQGATSVWLFWLFLLLWSPTWGGPDRAARPRGRSVGPGRNRGVNGWCDQRVAVRVVPASVGPHVGAADRSALATLDSCSPGGSCSPVARPLETGLVRSLGRPVTGARSVTCARQITRWLPRAAHRPRPAAHSPDARAQAPFRIFECSRREDVRIEEASDSRTRGYVASLRCSDSRTRWRDGSGDLAAARAHVGAVWDPAGIEARTAGAINVWPSWLSPLLRVPHVGV